MCQKVEVVYYWCGDFGGVDYYVEIVVLCQCIGLIVGGDDIGICVQIVGGEGQLIFVCVYYCDMCVVCFGKDDC